MTVEAVKLLVHEHQTQKKPFALVAFRVWPAEASVDFAPFVEAFLDSGTRLYVQDDGTWFYPMRDTLDEEGEDFARKIVSAAARREPPLSVGALVVPFANNWLIEKLLELPCHGWLAARAIPPQILGLWINSSQTWEFRTDVPTVPIVSRSATTADGLPSVSSKDVL